MSASLDSERTRIFEKLGVEFHEPVDVDGLAIAATHTPSDGRELSALLAELSDFGCSAIIRGSGSRMSLGNPPRRAELFISTEGMAGIREFDSEDGVLQAGAGTSLANIRDRVEAEGWELPIEAPHAGSTLGGALATASAGPRRAGYGPVRDCVLGMDVVLSSGEQTSCGGRVVKNVTGYDMAKLYTGSLGTLGVIEGVWLRLRPKPEATQLFSVTLDEAGEGYAAAREASLRHSARSVALLCPRAAQECDFEANWTVLTEFSGDEEVVAQDSDWWRGRIGSPVSVSVASRDRLSALQGSVLEEGGLRVMATMLPSQLQGASEAISAEVAAQVLYPGIGLLYAFSAAGSSQVTTAANACEGVVRAQRGATGSVVLEELPTSAKAGRDVFGEPGPEWRLMKALKQRFDPGDILNPGRFLGGL